MVIRDSAAVVVVDDTVRDEHRHRDIPVRVYIPERVDPASGAPVILFSHGLGGYREGNAYLGRHWAQRGYVCVFLQHRGSDRLVWQGKRPQQAMQAMRQAASAANLRLRVVDVSVVLDQLTLWQEDPQHVLFQRCHLQQVGMAGHSFGAITTQWVSGQRAPDGTQPFSDPRIKAAVMMSPSAPPIGSAQQAFAGVAIPWFLLTGTNDLAAIGHADLESRLSVFPALPDKNKFELVLADAEHAAFGDHQWPGRPVRRNPNHHPAILALTTAFWDAYLRDDKAALAWLTGSGPASVLQGDDRWQQK